MDPPDYELPIDYFGIYSDFDDGEGRKGLKKVVFTMLGTLLFLLFVSWNSRLVASHSTRPHTRFSIVDY